VRQSPTGGDSLIARVPDILKLLDEATTALLFRPLFPAPFGRIAILERGEKEIHIRYNRFEIEQAVIRLDEQLNPQQLNAMEGLECAIITVTEVLRLLPEECLVINNKTIVHGRTSFPAGSGRLLRRLKVYL
jgi:hypothetical protein